MSDRKMKRFKSRNTNNEKYLSVMNGTFNYFYVHAVKALPRPH